MKHTNVLQVMFSMGEEVSEEKAVEKIREADLDGDGRVKTIHPSTDKGVENVIEPGVKCFTYTMHEFFSLRCHQYNLLLFPLSR